MRDYCASEDAREDRGCQYATRMPPGAAPRRAVEPEEAPPEAASPEAASPEAAGHSYRDERIRAVVALDPALGPGHDALSLSRVQVPVHIVGSVENDLLPFAHHAGRYARLIPDAFLTPLAHGEGHFVYLNECSSDLEAQGVPLCRDREGARRSTVHARLEETIATFLSEHLAAA